MRKRDAILLAAALTAPTFGVNAWGQKGQTGGADERRRKSGRERVRHPGHHRHGNYSPVEKRSRHSHLLRAPLEARGTLAGAFSSLFRLGLGALALLAVAEAALVGVLTAVAEVRRKLQGEPQEGFPREEQPEIELESSEEQLKLYLDYEGLYEAMLEEIERAERTICIETFTWKDDEIGSRFVEALGRKAREGVEVYAVFDALGSPSAITERFSEEVHVLPFRPFSGPASFLNPYNLFRSHRKTLTVDGRVAFLGGWNIADVYRTRWRDTQVRIRGNLTREVEEAFANFWNEHRTSDLPEITVDRRDRDWNPATVLRVNDPTLGLFPIRAMFFGPMNRAKSHIYLTSVYFVPSRALKSRLIEAAKRGVDVQVLVPKQSSYALADWLARRHFDELLQAGVRIFEYDEHYVIHSKTTTIDGVWSTVGSANVDSLSLFGIHEINLEIYSERYADQMEEIFELDKTNTEEVTLDAWNNRPILHKLVERALTPLRPFV